MACERGRDRRHRLSRPHRVCMHPERAAHGADRRRPSARRGDRHRRGLRPARRRLRRRRAGCAAGAGLSPRAGGQAAGAARRRAQHRRRRQRHLDRTRRRAAGLRHRPRQCHDRRLDAALSRRAARRGRRAGGGGPRARRLRDAISATLLFRRASSEVARSQRVPAGACRRPLPGRRRRDADGLHRHQHRAGARALPRAAASCGSSPAAAGATRR